MRNENRECIYCKRKSIQLRSSNRRYENSALNISTRRDKKDTRECMEICLQPHQLLTAAAAAVRNRCTLSGATYSQSHAPAAASEKSSTRRYDTGGARSTAIEIAVYVRGGRRVCYRPTHALPCPARLAFCPPAVRSMQPSV